MNVTNNPLIDQELALTVEYNDFLRYLESSDVQIKGSDVTVLVAKFTRQHHNRG